MMRVCSLSVVLSPDCGARARFVSSRLVSSRASPLCVACLVRCQAAGLELLKAIIAVHVRRISAFELRLALGPLMSSILLVARAQPTFISK